MRTIGNIGEQFQRQADYAQRGFARKARAIELRITNGHKYRESNHWYQLYRGDTKFGDPVEMKGAVAQKKNKELEMKFIRSKDPNDRMWKYRWLRNKEPKDEKQSRLAKNLEPNADAVPPDEGLGNPA